MSLLRFHSSRLSLHISLFALHQTTSTTLILIPHLRTPIGLQTSYILYQRPSTSTMSSEHMIRVRLTILFFSLFSLGIAGLNSANARFAVVLRDRARSDYTNTSNGILDNQFQTLQSAVLIDTVATALLSVAFAIYGALVAFFPTRLRNHVVLYIHLILAVVMIGTGGYLADHVHGFQTSFEKFGAKDGIPYYSIVYYGGVAQAAYGSVLIFAAITAVVLLFAFYHYKMNHLVQATAREQAAPEYTEKDSSQV